MMEIKNKLLSESKVNSLVIMNIAPLTGKRDAAYDCAANMLKKDFIILGKEHKDDFYKQVIELINLANDCSNIISRATAHEHHSKKECNFLQYVKILRDTIKAASSLARHEMTLFAEEPVLNVVATKKAAKEQLKKADEIFFKSEKNIVKCIHDLMISAEVRIKSFRRHSQRIFNSNERVRYKKSYEQFTNLAEERYIQL